MIDHFFTASRPGHLPTTERQRYRAGRKMPEGMHTRSFGVFPVQIVLSPGAVSWPVNQWIPPRRTYPSLALNLTTPYKGVLHLPPGHQKSKRK